MTESTNGLSGSVTLTPCEECPGYELRIPSPIKNVIPDLGALVGYMYGFTLFRGSEKVASRLITLNHDINGFLSLSIKT